MRALGLFELLFINRHARTIKCISLELRLTKGPWACCVCASFAFGRDNDGESTPINIVDDLSTCLCVCEQTIVYL